MARMERAAVACQKSRAGLDQWAPPPPVWRTSGTVGCNKRSALRRTGTRNPPAREPGDDLDVHVVPSIPDIGAPIMHRRRRGHDGQTNSGQKRTPRPARPTI